MATTLPHRRCTYAEYLQLEAMANVKHEFYDGQILAMAGGSADHAAICASVILALGRQLEDRPCVVYSSDLKVRVMETGLTTYPDVSVVCGTREYDPESRHTITNPVVIVEVMSPGTEAYDRTDKLGHYKCIPSLRAIVLVSHDERQLELWHRAEGGDWMRSQARSGSISIPAINCSLDIDAVYRNVETP